MLHSINPEEHGPLGPEMASAVSTCVHCGFCLAACPTYQELGQEADSPRGRIILMKEVLEGSLPLAEATVHLDPCLGCLACEPACPSGVPYRDLITPFRSITESERRRSLAERFRRTMAQATLPYPSRFRMAAKLGRIAKAFPFVVPAALRAMVELLPDKLPKRQRWDQTHHAHGTRRARVALLTGCAQSVLDPDINTATISVLTRNGVEVVVPPNQTCCGALSWHAGNLRQAQSFAARNLKAFPSDVDAIITNAAGCGSGMDEYHLILKGMELEEQAKEFRGKVVDVSAFLARLGDLQPIPNQSKKTRIAYHDACHLGNAQGVRSEPRWLLNQIPDVEVCEINNAHLCCGSAGTYNIDQPEIAQSLGRQKAEQVIATGADVVVTGNIGCIAQISNHLRQLESPTQVRHTMQVIRDAYRSSH